VGCGVVSVLAGMVLSYELNLPTGATVILTQTALFVVALVASGVLKRGR
jgi:zinc transport system permease protein